MFDALKENKELRAHLSTALSRIEELERENFNLRLNASSTIKIPSASGRSERLLSWTDYQKMESQLTELRAENQKYREEMDKINNGIPSEWAYAILQKERDELRSENEHTLIDLNQAIYEKDKAFIARTKAENERDQLRTVCEEMASALEYITKTSMSIYLNKDHMIEDYKTTASKALAKFKALTEEK